MYWITWGKELLLLLPCPCPKISANGAPAEKDSVFNRRSANSDMNPGVTLAWKMKIIHPPFVNPCVLEQCKIKDRQACSPLIQLFFGFASDIDQTNINRDIRDGKLSNKRAQSKSWWFNLVSSWAYLVFPPQFAHEGGHVHRERGGVFQQGGGGQTFQWERDIINSSNN